MSLIPHQNWINGTIDEHGAGTRILALSCCSKWFQNQLNRPKTLICSEGIISHLEVILITAPGSGESRTFEVLVNGSAPGGTLTVTIADSATTAIDISNTVSVSADDFVSLRATDTGAPADTFLRFGARWTPTVKGETLFAGVVEQTNISNTDDISLAGSQDATIANFFLPLPCGGTIKNLHVRLNGAVGIGSRTFTLQVNGVDTSLTTTISSGTNGSDTSNSVAVSDGERICIHTTRSGIVSGRTVAVAVTFVPNNINDFVVAGTSDSILPKSPSSGQGKQLSTGDGDTGSGAAPFQLQGETRVKKMRVFLNYAGASPPAGGPPTSGSWTFSIAGPPFEKAVTIDHDDVQNKVSVFRQAFPASTLNGLGVTQDSIPNNDANTTQASVSYLMSTVPEEALPMFMGDR